MSATVEQRATRPTGRLETRLVLRDARLLIFTVVCVSAASFPTWTLRQGAVVSLALLVTALPDLRLRRPDVFMALYAALAWASLSWAVNPAASALGWRNTVAVAVLFITARALVETRRELRTIALALVAGCVAGLVRLMRENPAERLRLQYDSTLDRVGIEGLNVNYLAYSFATGAALIFLLWVTREKRRRPLVGLAAVGLCVAFFAGSILNGTRGSLVAFGLLTAWFVLARTNPARFLRVALFGTGAAAIVLVSGWLDEQLAERVGAFARSTGRVDGRLDIWPAARLKFWEHPIVGHGVDSFPVINPWKVAAHNAVLDVAVGLGVVGVALLVAVLVSAIREGGEGGSPRAALAMGAFVVVSAPILLTGFWTESPMFWLSLAVMSRLWCLGEQGSDEIAHQVDGDRLGRAGRSGVDADLDCRRSSSRHN